MSQFGEISQKFGPFDVGLINIHTDNRLGQIVNIKCENTIKVCQTMNFIIYFVKGFFLISVQQFSLNK